MKLSFLLKCVCKRVNVGGKLGNNLGLCANWKTRVQTQTVKTLLAAKSPEFVENGFPKQQDTTDTTPPGSNAFS